MEEGAAKQSLILQQTTIDANIGIFKTGKYIINMIYLSLGVHQVDVLLSEVFSEGEGIQCLCRLLDSSTSFRSSSNSLELTFTVQGMGPEADSTRFGVQGSFR